MALKFKNFSVKKQSVQAYFTGGSHTSRYIIKMDGGAGCVYSLHHLIFGVQK